MLPDPPNPYATLIPERLGEADVESLIRRTQQITLALCHPIPNAFQSEIVGT